MIFDFKSIVLYGLMTLAVASPVPGLTKRAKLGDFQCPDGTVLAEHDIREAFHECRRHDDGSIGKYPAKFGNKSGGGKVFSNIPDGTDLREFPIVEGGTFSGGKFPRQKRHREKEADKRRRTRQVSCGHRLQG
ncbi:hypothetical protein N7461_007385 [Penicillium sp. DV-2018c]|nr:hypothetical protein N7461_007385 [Penicillium sp. DV-2018c]